MNVNDRYYCPKCGKHTLSPYQNKAFLCKHCDFLYYHNVAATSSAIISVNDEILLVVRAREPQPGMLDLPGGFIEPDETAEQGLLRELKEELGLPFDYHGDYLCSSNNQYKYADVVYNTLDMFFHIALADKPNFVVDDDVADYRWFTVDSIPVDDIAFNSIKHAIAFYKSQQQSK